MASGYPTGSPHDQWGAKLPATTVTIPSLSSIFADQFFLGFNDQISRWQTLATMKKPMSFPPYNIIKVDADTYRVELAVAGYSKEDIDITVEKDLLTVKSNLKKDEKSEDEFLHQGIAERQWTQQFVLGEWMSIKEAALKDGLLTIKVEREVPEELKPKTIKIK